MKFWQITLPMDEDIGLRLKCSCGCDEFLERIPHPLSDLWGFLREHLETYAYDCAQCGEVRTYRTRRKERIDPDVTGAV